MVAFVILHYQDMDITQKCVVSIEKIMKESEYHIIIVDNASPNESGRKLEQYYEDNNNCTVICTKENLGFAQGNNIGYSYAKEKYSPNYIVVMNNDVMIEDQYFLKKIEKTYSDTKFHVLGPDIINVGTGQRQNPMRKHTKDEIMGIFSSYRRRYRFPRLYFTMEVAQGKFKRSIAKFKKNKERSESPNNVSKQERVYNPVLHGACYVLSELFINSEDIVFDPRTFL